MNDFDNTILIFSGRHGVPSCSVWDGMGDRGAGYKVAISNVFAAFILPLIIIVYPFIALLMQICGGRMPRYVYSTFSFMSNVSLVSCASFVQDLIHRITETQ